MTPADKADKAIRILELVDANVRHALKTRAYFTRYGDAEELLEQTAALNSRLNAAIRRLHCDFPDHEKTWTEHADTFWRMAIHTEGKEPTTESNASSG